MAYTERYKKPTKDNKNYYTDYNYFYPKWEDQCTWYVIGRLLELGANRAVLQKKVPQTNAENWYNDAKFPKQQEPEVGCYVCWYAGQTHHAADGMGHVAYVEHKYPDGAIRITESGKNMKFKTRILQPPYKFYLNVKHKENYKYAGAVKVLDIQPEEYWIEGKEYITTAKKYLRYDHCTGNNKVKYKNLSSSAKAKCDNVATYARTKVGSHYTFHEFATDSKGNIWGRTTPDGRDYKIWICVEDSTGKQVRRVD